MSEIKPYEERLTDYANALKHKDKVQKELRHALYGTKKFTKLVKKLMLADDMITITARALRNPKDGT